MRIMSSNSKTVWRRASLAVIPASLILASVPFGAAAGAPPNQPDDVKLQLVVGANPSGLSLISEARHFPITVLVEKADWVNCRSSRTPPFEESLNASGKTFLFTTGAESPGKDWRCQVTYRWMRGDSRLSAVRPCSFALPFDQRGAFRIIQGFDGSFSHNGKKRYALDFSMPEGTPIRASREGTVIYVMNDNRDGERPEGNEVTILHPDGSQSGYAHLERGSITVRPGDRVLQGSIIARSGRSGNIAAMAAHLHFEVFVPHLSSGLRVTIPFDLKFADGRCGVPKEGEFL